MSLCFTFSLLKYGLLLVYAAESLRRGAQKIRCRFKHLSIVLLMKLEVVHHGKN